MCNSLKGLVEGGGGGDTRKSSNLSTRGDLLSQCTINSCTTGHMARRLPIPDK